jgi:hypothetical protein
MVMVAAVIQFGIIFWGQNTLTQVARDTGRWAATQATCPTATTVVPVANSIAASSSLIGYAAGSWSSPQNVQVTLSGDPCPVTTNQKVAYVTISISHQVPVFFPWVPGNGNLSTSAQFRMEPKP